MKHHRFKLFLALLFTALLAGGNAKAAETLVIPGPNLDVFVDIDTCAQGFTWCSGSGSVGPAADGNDSVVGIVIHVKRNNGSPVTGAPETFFALTTITSPSGLTTGFVDSVTCAACFAEPVPGVYRLAARPNSGGDWMDGTYMLLLEFGPAGTPFFQTVIPLDIPL